MNREIKFRAWDKELNKMWFEVQDFYDTLCEEEHGNIDEPENYFGAVLDKPIRYEVMQYTGLKDKNGKEIYEGDIIHYFRKSTDSFDNDYEYIFVVVFEEGMFKAKDRRIALNKIADECGEVIGNVWENPELT